MNLRPFIYVLKMKPDSVVIRGLCVYDPEEMLGGK